MSDAALNPCQVFVRNLPYDATSEDLVTLFQDIGPLKRSSIATDSGGSSKGFGFVKFALEEDAKKALSELKNLKFKGRTLQLEQAFKPTNTKKSKKNESNDDGNDSNQHGNKSEGKSIAVPTVSITDTISKTNIPSTSNSKNVDVKSPGASTSSADKRKSITVKTQSKSSSGSIEQSKPTPSSSSLPSAPSSSSASSSSYIISSADVQPSTSRSLKVLVFGLPSSVKKKDFKRVSSKACRKAEINTIDETHSLNTIVKDILSPAGKVFILLIPSRKYAPKLLEYFDTKPVHSLFPTTVNGTAPITDVATTTTATLHSSSSSSSHKGLIFARSLADITEPTLRRKKCRLIIRNLSFQATEQNIVDKLNKFGPIIEVSIPRVEVKSSTGENDNNTNNSTMTMMKLAPRGFGFITFLCEKDALKAVESSAGLKVCNREVAIDFCSSKEIFKRINESALASAEGESEPIGETLEDSTEMNIDHDDDENDDDDDDGDDDVNSSDVDEDDDNDDINDDDDDEEEDEDMNKNKSKHTKPPQSAATVAAVSDAQEMKTVFLRELAFDATEDDIRTALAPFGKINLAIVVKDKESGISKGSAFVKFSHMDEAQACINAFHSHRSAVLIKDRECKADFAVEKEKVKNLQELKFREKNGKRAEDKRNLYLANEGLLLDANGNITTSTSNTNNDKNATKTNKKANTALLSQSDLDKRRKAQMDKRKKLTNPLFFVSANRLSVRNLPKSLTDHDLKIMCLRAMKSGLNSGLVNSNDVQAQLFAQGELDSHSILSSNNNSIDDRLAVPEFTKNAVTSAKVMLDLTKVKNGVPQSKRYGFVEFKHHAHALACLRELNNAKDCLQYLPPLQRQMIESNPQTQTQQRMAERLLVEFSLENFSKVRQLQKRLEHNIAPSSSSSSSSKGGGVGGDVKEKSSVIKSNDKKNKRGDDRGSVNHNNSSSSSSSSNVSNNGDGNKARLSTVAVKSDMRKANNNNNNNSNNHDNQHINSSINNNKRKNEFVNNSNNKVSKTNTMMTEEVLIPVVENLHKQEKLIQMREKKSAHKKKRKEIDSKRRQAQLKRKANSKKEATVVVGTESAVAAVAEVNTDVPTKRKKVKKSA